VAVLILQLNPQLVDKLKHFKNSHQPQNITLRYFNTRGRAEPIRLLLEQAGADYKEIRVQGEQWPELKKSWSDLLTYGQLPHLSDGSFHISQSSAIIRYLAKKFNFNGKTLEEETLCDVVAGGVDDFRTKYLQLVYNSNFSSLKEAYITTTVPQQLQNFEKLLEKNGAYYGRGLYFVGDQLTFSDILVYDVLDVHSRLAGPEFLADFPLLKAFKTRVEELPRISNYLQSDRRPKRTNGKIAFFDN